MSNIRYFILIAFLLATLASCEQGNQSTSANTVDLEKPKIISIGGTITEIVFALGAYESIIATDPTSTYPKEAQNLPSLGYKNAIKVEGLISLGSDVIIAEKGHLSDDVKQQLSATGTNWHEIENQYTVDGTLGMIDEVAAILNLEERATSLKNEFEESIQSLAAKVQARENKPSVLMVYARGAGSLTVGGSNTFAETLFPLAGCKLAIIEIDGFKPLTTEALIQANPDYILFFDSGLASLGGIDGALDIPGIAETNAGKKRQIISMDGLLVSGFGSRLHQAVNTLFDLTESADNPSL